MVKPNTRAGEALKPCPFCGSPAYMHCGSGRDYDRHVIKCDGDTGRVRCPVYPTTGALLPKAEAITAWNTRSLPQPSELVERLKRQYPTYLNDRDGLKMFRDAVLHADGHDMAAVNHNSLGRLLDTISDLEAQIAKLQTDKWDVRHAH